VLLGLILVISKLAWFSASSNTLRLSPSGWLGLPMGLHGGLVWGYYMTNHIRKKSINFINHSEL